MSEETVYLFRLDGLNEEGATFECATQANLWLTRDEWERLGSRSELFVRVTPQSPFSAPELESVHGPELAFSAVTGNQPVSSPGPWTSHGHSIPGVTIAGPKPLGLLVARCGGVPLCPVCRREAGRLGGRS